MPSRRKYSRNIHREAQKALRLVTRYTERQAKRLAPVDTGRLKRSIYSMRTSKHSTQVRTDLYYAKWVEFGRGPVRPRRRKYLRFTIGGRVIFTKYARPARGRFFMTRAAKLGQKLADRISSKRR